MARILHLQHASLSLSLFFFLLSSFCLSLSLSLCFSLPIFSQFCPSLFFLALLLCFSFLKNTSTNLSISKETQVQICPFQRVLFNLPFFSRFVFQIPFCNSVVFNCLKLCLFNKIQVLAFTRDNFKNAFLGVKLISGPSLGLSGLIIWS